MSLIHRITERDERHIATLDIVTAAAAGTYFAFVDNVWPRGAVKTLSAFVGERTIHDDFALTRVVLRNAGGYVPFVVGQIADGFYISIYQMSNVAQTVTVWCAPVISR